MQASVSKTIGIISLLLVLAGCTTSTAPPASKEEQDQAGRAFLACLDRSIPQIDDRVSDAITIAIALVNGPCSQASGAVLEVFSRDLSPLARKKFYDHPYSVYQLAMEAVLRHRARR